MQTVQRPAWTRVFWTRRTRTQLVGFTGDDLLRAVFSLLVVGPKMLGIMAGMDQKDSGIVVVMAATYAWLVLLVSLFALCPFGRRQAQMLGIMAGMNQKDTHPVGWFCW